jgi:diguanylate cyclase (GGDEF)-like protein
MIVWRQLVFYLGFAAVYAAGVIFSDLFIPTGEFSVTPIWPPAGIGLACLLLGGIRAWPILAIGYLAGQILGAEIDPVFFALALIANVGGPIVGTLFLRRIQPQRLILNHLRNGMLFFAGGLVLSLFSTLFGTLAGFLSGTTPIDALGVFALQWFLGDLFGVIVATPALLSIGRTLLDPKSLTDDATFARHGEKATWLTLVAVSAFLWIWLESNSPNFTLAITFLPLIFLCWSALRFDHLFSTIAVMAITLTLVIIIGKGMSAFAQAQGPIESAVLLLFFSTIAVLPMLVSAASQQGRFLTDKLEFRANHDALTGLPNRPAFEDYAKERIELARLGGKPAALCYLDLDNFKVVNDTSGHVAGDELLKQIAHVLQSNLLPNEKIARLGGDEFGFVFEDCTAEEAEEKAQRLTKLIDEFRFVWRKHIFAFTASVGVVPIDTNALSFAKIMSQVDAACYEAKLQGGNRALAAHDGAAIANQSTAMHWAVRITEALERNRFRLFAQRINPVVDSNDKQLHLEILLRMADKEGHVLAPSIFIPAAERFNMMPKIDRWVVKNTLRWMHHNPDYVHWIGTCAINLSGQSLGDLEFLDFLQDRLRHTSIAKKLCFEITETAAIGELGQASQFIDTLRDLGCRFSLDDFGAGLSSFSYLKSLKVDYLKIDGSFVRDLDRNPVDRTMVKSINEVGHVMGKKTVAEFVESKAVQEALAEIGVDFAQGHFFGKACAIDLFFAGLEEEFSVDHQQTGTLS